MPPTDQTEPPKDIEQFVEWVMKQKPGLAEVEPEVWAQIKTDFVERLQDRINAEILTQIPEDKLDEFDRLLSAGDGKAAQAFCEANVPDMAELVARVLLDFKLEYVGA